MGRNEGNVIERRRDRCRINYIGANSFVCKKKFPPNCCLAGIPAKIIRERTAWIRDGISIHKDIEDYQEFIYDEQY